MPLDNIQPINTSNILSESQLDLGGKWAPAIGGFVLSNLATMAAGFIPFGGLVIAGPMALGLAIFYLNIAKNKDARIEHIFDGFKNFGTSFAAAIFSTIFIILWSLLLVVPGIIAALSYSLAFFIIAEDDNIGAMDAISKSKEMMKGHKMELFIMYLIFMGMAILCLFTLGIGFLWLGPFTYVSLANFYLKVKGEEDELNLEDNLII